jgi:cytochrome c oxidase subunit 2
MAIAVALLLIVIGSVVFQLVSPWGLTPLASNWATMDHTMVITLVITGVFFVVINLFVVYTVIRFRHRKGQRAAYEPENPRLEKWLIGVTTVGVVALLAPGLVVYAAYVNPPHDAMVLEIIGQQWQWRYRFPGPDGKLGATDARFVGPGNPLGLDPDDATGRENIIVNGNEVHLPVNKPVRVLLRSHDVLHDFFVPQFRARMNIVPGQVSSFWFTPTQVGRYEGMCAQLCGVGHPNMRGTVIVEDEMKFAAWLKTQPTFAATRAPATLPKVGDPNRARRRRWANRWRKARAAWPAIRSTAAAAPGRPGKVSSARPKAWPTVRARRSMTPS